MTHTMKGKSVVYAETARDEQYGWLKILSCCHRIVHVKAHGYAIKRTLYAIRITYLRLHSFVPC